MTQRSPRRIRLHLGHLEDRNVPVFAQWPFAGGPATNPVVGTFGQYQDAKRADGFDHNAISTRDSISPPRTRTREAKSFSRWHRDLSPTSREMPICSTHSS